MRFFKRPTRYEITTQRDTLSRSLKDSIQENVELQNQFDRFVIDRDQLKHERDEAITNLFAAEHKIISLQLLRSEERKLLSIQLRGIIEDYFSDIPEQKEKSSS